VWIGCHDVGAVPSLMRAAGSTMLAAGRR
jgi:hypothetical protein